MTFVEKIDKTIKLWAYGDIFTALNERPSDEVYEFCELVALISKHHFQANSSQQVNENFSFIANTSLSGGRHPCGNPECRIEKIKELVSFSTLYADEVYIQSPFEDVYIKGADNLDEKDRVEIILGVQQYIYLKPLFKEGIVKYAQNEISLCHHHNETLAKPLAEKIAKKEEKLYHIFHDYLIDKCSFTLKIDKYLDQTIEILGPKELIEHGATYHYLFEPSQSLAKYLNKGKKTYKFSKSEVIDEGLMAILITPILTDLSKQEWHSAFNGTSYLCNNPVQIQLASKLNNKAYIANSEAIEKSMSHYLPTVYSKDVTSILDLRDKEKEAFKVYRDKIAALIRESKSWKTEDVSRIFRDEVLPEINLLEKKVNDWKTKSRGSIKEKIIFGSGAVSVGLYSGMLPPDIGNIIAGLGGSTAIVGSLMDYNQTLKEENEARTNDLYFLWQANK